MAVEVVRAGIRSQLRSFEVAFIRLRSSLAGTVAAGVFEQALSRCVLEEDRPDFGAMVTPSGPVTMVEDIDRPELWAWLDQVAVELSQAGVSGSLVAAASAKSPEVFPQGRVATAAVVFESQGKPWPGRGRWPLTGGETSRVVDRVVEWSELAGGQQWLGLNLKFWLAGSSTRQLAGPMRAAVPTTKTQLVVDADGEARRVTWSWHDLTAQVIRSPRGWEEQVDVCRRVLLWAPELVSWGIVGTSEFPGLGWVVSLLPKPPLIRDNLAAFGLRGTLVDAVQGIQLVTGAHLARSHDLSDWSVTEVAPDRYLVEARDLRPWFSEQWVDPEVHAQAAHDFGPMLLTDQTATEFGITR